MSAEFKTFAQGHFDRDEAHPIFGDEMENTPWWNFHSDKQRRKALVALERSRCEARTAEVTAKQRMNTAEWDAKAEISKQEAEAQVATAECECNKAIKVARAPYSWIAPTAWAITFAVGFICATVAYIFKPL